MIGRDGVLSFADGGVLAADCKLGLGWRRVPAAVVGGLLACVAALAVGTLVTPTAVRNHRPPSRGGLQGRVPSGLLAAASASLGSSEHGFWPVRRGRSLLAQGGGIKSEFTASGAELRTAGGTLGLSLTAVGRGQRLDRLTALPPSASANEILYRHGSVVEFYRNGPYGLEQGFTVRHHPQGPRGSLVLAMSLSGSLIPEQVGPQVLLRTASGVTQLRYGQLSAQDATGRRLAARMQLRDGELWLQIDDHNARYPLTEAGRRTSTAEDGSQGAVATSIKQGGDQMEYEDQDPRIHEIWLEEMRKAGIEPQFAKYGGSMPREAVAR